MLENVTAAVLTAWMRRASLWHYPQPLPTDTQLIMCNHKGWPSLFRCLGNLLWMPNSKGAISRRRLAAVCREIFFSSFGPAEIVLSGRIRGDVKLSEVRSKASAFMWLSTDLFLIFVPSVLARLWFHIFSSTEGNKRNRTELVLESD